MSDAAQQEDTATQPVLDPDDRAWLEARRCEYRELLAYLHEY